MTEHNRMCAVVLERAGTLVYREVPLPALQPGWVRLTMGAASICGSDVLRVYEGHAKVLPIILGHECAGTVTAVGEGVDAGLIGKRCAIIPLIPTMDTDLSRRGLYASSPGYSFIGSRIDGGFADQIAAPAANIIELPDSVSLEIGALLEPCTVAYHALLRGGGAAGKRVAVLGAGSIGLLTVQIAVALGAAQVIALDIADHRLAAAREFGASAVINPRSSDAVAEVLALTSDGVDLALEVAGAPSALEQSIYITRPGGDIVFVGNQPQDASLSLAHIEQVMRRQLNLHGAWMSYSAPFPGREWHGVLDLMAAGALKLEAMISHRVTLAALPQMFAQIHNRAVELRKVIVTP
jgi:L-iditol 2-dehydrogenase